MESSLHEAFREAAPRVLGALVRRFKDFDASEDALQEALLAAFLRTEDDEVPTNPAGWLWRIACRRIADRTDAESARRRREDASASSRSEASSHRHRDDSTMGIEDETLEMMFLCCHESLSPQLATALTLRAIGGLTTAEIASAFMVPKKTMEFRIARAKQVLAPHQDEIVEADVRRDPARLAHVRLVLYLVFNEGYAASSGPKLERRDLAKEAIRLARELARQVPNDAETEGLLALMLLTDARSAARSDANGRIIPLDEQDRSLWDRSAIDEGTMLVTSALSRGAVGPYQIQAAVASLHDEAPSTEATDWRQIAALYALLRRIADTPMAALSQAVAVGMVEGPEAGLAMLDTLAGDAHLELGHRLIATRAHLLERAGRRSEAREAFVVAAERASSIPERHHLLMKAARLGTTDGGSPPA